MHVATTGTFRYRLMQLTDHENQKDLNVYEINDSSIGENKSSINLKHVFLFFSSLLVARKSGSK